MMDKANEEPTVATPQNIFGEEEIGKLLAKDPAIVYLDRSVALTRYYLNRNAKEGIWQAQHL